MGLTPFLQAAPSGPDPRDTKNPFGVLDFLDWNQDWNGFQYDSPAKIERAAALMEKAGVGMVRQPFPWNTMEEEKGRIQFDRYDQILDILGRHHIAVLGLISYSALWTHREWNAPPDPEAFLKFTRAVVRRYKDRIKYWELWNEPDHSTYWNKQDQMQTYTELLKVFTPAVKEEDPTAMVVLGSGNTAFPIRQMYRNGAKAFFDVVNIHPFWDPLKPNAILGVQGIYKGVLKAMEENQDTNKPIWITEVGCPGIPPLKNPPTWWEGKATTETEQAAWVTTVYQEALTWPGVERIFWAFFRDTDHFHDAVDYFGLLRRNFSPKPSYNAYRRASREWRLKHKSDK